MSLRKYGKQDYRVAVIHGGPGAIGSVQPVCEEISEYCGVLEPLLTERTVEGQLNQILDTLGKNVKGPATLIGHSWGAMLVYIFAARYPVLVRKIILVSSGPLEEFHADGIHENRESRLTAGEQEELERIRLFFSGPRRGNPDRMFARYGALMEKADSYAPLELHADDRLFSYEVYARVWPEVLEMRKRGLLLEMGNSIRCPVTVIHGDYDSHPAWGIKASLDKLIPGYQFYCLHNCGHTPWMEKYARARFYRILRQEIMNAEE